MRLAVLLAVLVCVAQAQVKRRRARTFGVRETFTLHANALHKAPQEFPTSSVSEFAGQMLDSIVTATHDLSTLQKLDDSGSRAKRHDKQQNAKSRGAFNRDPAADVAMEASVGQGANMQTRHQQEEAEAAHWGFLSQLHLQPESPRDLDVHRHGFVALEEGKAVHYAYKTGKEADRERGNSRRMRTLAAGTGDVKLSPATSYFNFSEPITLQLTCLNCVGSSSDYVFVRVFANTHDNEFTHPSTFVSWEGNFNDTQTASFMLKDTYYNFYNIDIEFAVELVNASIPVAVSSYNSTVHVPFQRCLHGRSVALSLDYHVCNNTVVYPREYSPTYTVPSGLVNTTCADVLSYFNQSSFDVTRTDVNMSDGNVAKFYNIASNADVNALCASNPTEYNCSGRILTVSQYNEDVALPSGSGNTCSSVLSYFQSYGTNGSSASVTYANNLTYVLSVCGNSTTFNDTTHATMCDYWIRCRNQTLCTSIPSTKYPDLSLYCAAWPACQRQQMCEPHVSRGHVCYCPRGYHGQYCQSRDGHTCEVTMHEPVCDPNLPARKAYRADLDGPPPCYSAEPTISMSFSVSCHYTSTVSAEGFALTVNPDAQFHRPTFSYLSDNETNFFDVAEFSTPLALQVKFFNLVYLSDNSQRTKYNITNTHLLRHTRIPVVVDTTPFIDEFQAGGRLYMEARVRRRSDLQAASGMRSPARRVLFDVPGWQMPPPPPAALSDAEIAIVVIVCVGVVAACFLLYRLKLAKEEKAAQVAIVRDGEERRLQGVPLDYDSGDDDVDTLK